MLVACPSCSRAMRLDDVGGVARDDRFECPHCKAQFGIEQLPKAQRVASTGASPTTLLPTQAVAAKPSHASSLEPERDILMLYPSLLCARPLLWLGLAAGALLGVGVGIGVLVRSTLPSWAGIGIMVLGLASGVLLAVWRPLLSGSQIRVTNKRLIDRDGVVHRHVSEVLHKDVKNIRVEQTLWQRLCGAGSLAIYTSGAQEPEVFMDNVPSPHKVREVIDGYRPL